MATLLVLLAVAVVLRYGLSEPWRARLRRAVNPALLMGGVGFALGFFGPMIFAPGANQGPMLGIFISGPLGFLAGLLWGVGREVLRRDRTR
jgi:hypothetical protein